MGHALLPLGSHLLNSPLAPAAPVPVPQVRYEDAQAAFNRTCLSIAQEFYPRVRAGGGCWRALTEWWLLGVRQPASTAGECPIEAPHQHRRLLALQDAGGILEAAQECDPTTWSDSQRSANNHVTAAKHPAGSRERLQAVLGAQPDIAAHLCAVAAALGYADARCGDGAKRDGGFM